MKTYILQKVNKCDAEKVIVEDGVTQIEDDEFCGCDYLRKIIMPNTLKYIGQFAFSNCRGLTRISIPENVTNIDYDAFNNCEKLKRVDITNMAKWCSINFHNYFANPLAYGHKLYLNDELVTNLVIPNGIEKIKDYTFCGCDSITTIDIPDGVTYIGIWAFAHCHNLKRVNIPNSVMTMKSGVFHSCDDIVVYTDNEYVIDYCNKNEIKVIRKKN